MGIYRGRITPAETHRRKRSFSAAGRTISSRRTAVDSETVEDILFVHSNALSIHSHALCVCNGSDSDVV